MKLYYIATVIALVTLLVTGCTYDEGITTVDFTIELSRPISDVNIEISNSMGQRFATMTDAEGIARLRLVSGIYSITASKTEDDGYVRLVYNATGSDVVVGTLNTSIRLEVKESTVLLNNPVLIKEIYVGGCQKDDGSGKFANDKCIILYNNSSAPASLDDIAIGMIEPYNAEANVHSFLSGGELDYASEDWIPAINGIWYFQPGSTIQPYTELVVNVVGAIDNTLTYKNSVNYANPAYYCMYDVEATSKDGGKYNNTSYYPSPSELIPTSHYLKAVKYGQGSAWPLSQTSPAIILFKSNELPLSTWSADDSNIIYPSDKVGNLIYACLKVPRSWVLDAVEVFNAEKFADCRRRLTPDLDAGYALLTSGYGHSLVRKIEKEVDGNIIYLDTNNSTNDFYEAESCSIR